MMNVKPSKSVRPIDSLDILGADANNLKHIDVHIPLIRVTVVTGVSGSGKSSLITDTLAVEADRRMRAFLGIHQPHLEGPPTRAFIGPMPAALHVGQRAFRASARTTVGTATGLLTTLRRLFVICSKPYSDDLGRFIPDPSPKSYTGWLVKHYRGHVTVWAAPVRFVATDGLRHAARLREHGIDEVVVRSETDAPKVWERGRTVPLAKFKPLRSDVRHILEAKVGDLELKSTAQEKSVEELLKRAFEAGQGQVVIELSEATQPELRGPFGPRLDAALHHVDPESPRIFFRPSTHLLSFNAPEHPESGACRTCLGLGRATTLDERALVTHPERSMHEGAFSLWTDKNFKYVNIQHTTIEGLRGVRGFSPDVPWKKLPEGARRLILDGAGAELIVDKDPKTGRQLSAPRPFEGFRCAVLQRFARGTKVSESLRYLVTEGTCPDCRGARWSYQARALRIADLGIHQLLADPFIDLVTHTAEDSPLARAVPVETAALVRALHHHAAAFVSVGLSHLTGARGMLEISEGESRRARLAAVLNARQEDLCLLLDEPARGLHDEDVQTMAEAIAELGRRHTLVVSEHRYALNKAADYVIELGPGAGRAGGEVVFEGPVKRSSWAKEPIIERARTTKPLKPRFLVLRGVTIHNLNNVDCEIPLGRLICLAGLSGSGKSSFVRGALVPAVARALSRGVELTDFEQRPGTWTRIEGAENIKGLVALDQRIPPPNRRSVVATFLELSEVIRTAFGTSEQARRAGLSPSDFGLNAGAGRCQLCLGIGEVPEDDLWTTCPGCGGARFGQEALSVRIEERNISELLDLPVTVLSTRLPKFLSAHKDLLAAMTDLGIGHIALGRRIDTLSGGEVQRLRIAAKLAEREAGGLLFVLDEPAAGLHPRDVEHLVHALDRILDHGKNTIVLVEHNPAILKAADWIIEFGPGSGPHGGRVVAEGTPEVIAETDTATGRVLSGRPAPARPRLHPMLSPRTRRKPSEPVKQAERVKAWIRHILGDNVALPEDAPDDDSPERPIAILSERALRGRRAFELGDLDLEIAKLLLDMQVREPSPEAVQELVLAWTKEPDARLLIHPLLRDLQVWGPRLPESTIQVTCKHVEAMGLKLLTDDGKPLTSRNRTDALAIRATGDRFVPRRGTPDERAHILRDALALGGGHVELRGPRGQSYGRLGPRLLDLERGIIAPMAVAPFHFSRHSCRGQCPTCKGTGQVMTFNEDLVIADHRAVPEADDFLHAAAANVMKGIRRSELLPFLRRLTEEGLWKKATPYQRLDQAARDLLLFGCWTRPGHGTFLKSPKDDPSEVGSWLRWDGLYNALRGQIERSTDARWKIEIEGSRTSRTCPTCDGTGLAAHAKLLALAGRSLHEWIRDGETGAFHEALHRLKPTTPRQQRTQQRILACLAPLAGKRRPLLLREPVDVELAHELGRCVVEAFTDMPVVFP